MLAVSDMSIILLYARTHAHHLQFYAFTLSANVLSMSLTTCYKSLVLFVFPSIHITIFCDDHFIPQSRAIIQYMLNIIHTQYLMYNMCILYKLIISKTTNHHVRWRSNFNILINVLLNWALAKA